MFEFQFSKPSKQTLVSSDIQAPSDFIKKEEIQTIRPTWWGEHCVECSEPLCFTTCNHYEKRCDGKCRRFKNGIICNESQLFKDFISSAEISFKEWGKLETVIFPGMTTLEKVENKNNPLISKSVTLAEQEEDNHGSVLLDKFNEIYEEGNIQGADILDDDELGATSDYFLLQVYSFNEEKWDLAFELTSLRRLIHRSVFPVNKGFNQFLIHTELATPKSKTFMYTPDVLMARLIPVNDYNAHIVILSSDFVNPKEESKTKWMNIAKSNSDSTQEEIGIVVPSAPAKKVKVVCWDLDNTIWDGTLVETPNNSLKIRNGIKETIEQLDKKGIVQMVVSKNQEDDAVFELKRLGIDDFFVYKMINWSPKSQNIKKIADALNLNLNSFAFIDDQVFERTEVLNAIPCIRTYNETEATTILDLPEFDTPITNDSKKRREMYQTEAKRVQIKNSFSGTNTDFVKSCQMVVTAERPDTNEKKKRSYELLQRANQLNLSGIKYSEDSFNYLINNSYRNSSVCFFCNDKFGNYGQIGFISLFKNGATLEVREFAMSCRVMGKYVENAICNWLCDLAINNNCEKVTFIGRKTDRNAVMTQTLKQIGFESSEALETEIRLERTTSICIPNSDVVTLNAEACKDIELTLISNETEDFAIKQFSDYETIRTKLAEINSRENSSLNELSLVKNSTTYKVGKALMFIPCSVKKLFNK